MATKAQRATEAAAAAVLAAQSKKATQVAAPAVHGTKKGGSYVTVACKFPNGLILHVDEPYTSMQQTPTGPISITMYRSKGPSYFVRGPVEPNGQVPKGYKRPVLEGGYALTRNIPEDFWKAWLDQNRDGDLIKNDIIKASDQDSIIDIANEYESVRTGFEPLDPDAGDPRIPKSQSAAVSNIEAANISAAEAG